MAEIDKGLVLRLEATTLLLSKQLQAASNEVEGFANKSNRAITVSSAQQQNAIKNLGFQFNDFLTQIQGGTPILRAFAQQSGQAAGALADMGGKAGVVGRFFSSVLGGGLLAAGTALATYVLTLDDANEALELAKVGSSGLADAQSALGDIFDLTSGKLKTQNELLRTNAELTAVNLRAEAEREKASSKGTLGRAGEITALGGFMRSVTTGKFGDEISGPVTTLLAAMRAGRISRGDALKRSASIDFSGLAITREQFQQALVDELSSAAKSETADKIEKSLRDGVLDPSLRRPGREKKGSKPSEMDAWAQSMGFKNYEDWDQSQIEPLRRKAGQQEPFDSLAKGSEKFADSMERIKVDTGDLIQHIDIAGGPILQLFDQLTAESDHLSRSLESIAADGLESLGDGIADAITGAQSLADAFKNVADQVIADLVRIAVRQSIIKPLAGALGLGGGGSGLFGSLFGGGRATGGAVEPGMVYEVGERGREFFAPTVPGTIIPNHDVGRFAGGGGISVAVDARGATDPAMVEQAAHRAIFAAAPLIVAAAQGKTMTQIQRPMLPMSAG